MELKDVKVGQRVRINRISGRGSMTSFSAHHQGYIGDVIAIDKTDDDLNIELKLVHHLNPVPCTVAFGNHKDMELYEEPVKWVRPKADNNIVNNAVRVLAKVYTYVSNAVVKAFKFLRGSK